MGEPAVDIAPLTAALGAEVRGVDLGDLPGDPALVAAVRGALVEHHVLVFRDQRLDRAAHKAAGACFGDLHVHPSRRREGVTDPEIFPVRADADSVLNNGGLWHSDLSCEAVPPLGSMLLLTETPPTGGDTLFANMHLAYERLSEPIRELLGGLTAVHDQRHDLANYGHEPQPGVDYPICEHPVVAAHPDTGRPYLFVNSSFTTRIVELRPAESDALLRMLADHIATDPSLHCRVRWEPGTLTFWDNRSCQHHAVWDYWPAVRRGERVTIADTSRPVPAPTLTPERGVAVRCCGRPDSST